MSPRFLSRQSVAELFDTSPRTVSRWVEKGVLPPPIRIGGLKRWSLDALMLAARDAMDERAGTAFLRRDRDEVLTVLRRMREELDASEEERKARRRRLNAP